MFNVSLSDRLKAAVNTLEATGSSLQARAIAQAQGGQSHSQPSSPHAGVKSPPGTTPLASPSINTSAVVPNANDGTAAPSPTRSQSANVPSGSAGAYSTSQLAENALSGLRKSFAFGRPSSEGQRPSLSSLGIGGTGGGGSTEPNANGSQELKDIASPPNSAIALSPPSRSVSPNPAGRLFGALTSNFTLGSDPSSLNGTPRPRSPNPATSSHLATSSLPKPDPSDPATYPLPPSPVLTASTPLVPPTPLYSDPLGASPLLQPEEQADPPTLGLQAPTPEERSDRPDALSSLSAIGSGEVNGSSEHSATNGDSPEKPALVGVASSVDMDMEKRYAEMTERYNSLLVATSSANKVLKEQTQLEGGVQDAEALEDWIRMKNGKVDMITEEMKRLQAKIALQESRMEELRDTHRLEGTSQTELVAKLRSQLSTAESNLASKASDLMAMGTLRADLAKAQTQAKEEEEKRTKAISLLKTVRMKLVKTEKDREEVERDRAEERAERSKAAEEMERIKMDREREVNNLRKGFERELAGAKDRYEKDLQAKKAAWELELITTKASHAKELSQKSTKVSGLEAIVKELNLSKQQQFETLEARQSEVETSRTEMEVLQNRTRELEYQLREATERCAILEDQANSSARGRTRLGMGLDHGRETPSPSPSRQNSYSATSTAEVQRLLAEAEAKSEAKMSDLKHKIRSLEGERNDLEEEWQVKLQVRVREIEKLRRAIAEKESDYAESLTNRKEKEDRIELVEEQKRGLERDISTLKAKLEEVRGDVTVASDAERSAKDEISSLQTQISSLNVQLEDTRTLATQLRAANKTLREELRKVQSSVQLMERSRNPGVGYWSSSAGAGASASAYTAASSSSVPPPRSGVASPGSESVSMISTPTKGVEKEWGSSSRRSMESVDRSGLASPAPSESVKPVNEEEEVNLEYLRNVILQFLEHKEMRPNLVRVLSVILRFTPQELRRLNAKLLS